MESAWENTPDKTVAQLQKLAEDLKALDPEIVDDAVRKGKQGIPFAKEFELDKDEDFDIAEDDAFRVKSGFWAEGEESMGADEDYFGDDITSHGHGELQKHRELREYARLIAWELPLLSRRFICVLIGTMNVHTNMHQNWPVLSNPLQPVPPSAFATPPTWANLIQQLTKWLWSSRHQTLVLRLRSAQNSLSSQGRATTHPLI